MVNTMVKDPQNRKINRKLDRQKKARMKQNRKVLLDPLASGPDSPTEVHTLRISELKKEREELRDKKQSVPDSGNSGVFGKE